MGDVRGVFAALRPFERDAEGVQDFRRGTFRDDFYAERFTDFAGFARGTLATPRAGGRAFENGVDELAADGFVHDLIRGQIELQKTHRAFDVHADGAGINVRWRREHA